MFDDIENVSEPDSGNLSNGCVSILTKSQVCYICEPDSQHDSNMCVSLEIESLVFDCSIQLLFWLIKMFMTLICLPWTYYFIKYSLSAGRIIQKKLTGLNRETLWIIQIIEIFIDLQRIITSYHDIMNLIYVRMAVLSFDTSMQQVNWVQHLFNAPTRPIKWAVLNWVVIALTAFRTCGRSSCGRILRLCEMNCGKYALVWVILDHNQTPAVWINKTLGIFEPKTKTYSVSILKSNTWRLIGKFKHHSRFWCFKNRPPKAF